MSSNMEKKLDKFASKNISRARGFLHKQRPEDSKQVTLEAERRADENLVRAETLSAATRTIESLIIALAQKWKPQMSGFFNEVQQNCQEPDKKDVLPVLLVDTLIRSYEREWKLRVLSEKWDTSLWKEIEKLLSNMNNDETKESSSLLQEYHNEVNDERKGNVEEMDRFMERLDKQLEKITQLEAENALLKQKQDDRIANLLVEADGKHKNELIEQDALHKAELQRIRDDHAQSEKHAKDEFHTAKLDLQRNWRRSKDLEIKEMETQHKLEIKQHKIQYKQLASELEDSQRTVEKKIEEAKAGWAIEERKMRTDQETRNKTFKDHLATVEQRNEADKQKLSRELNMKISDLKFEMEDLENSHIATVQDIEQSHAIAWKAMEQSHVEAFENQKQAHSFEIAQLNESARNREEELEARFQRLQKEALADSSHLKSKISNMEEEHRVERQQLLTACEREKDDLESQVKEEVARLRNEYAKKKSQLETVHAASTTQLKNDVEAYSAALLARDDFKPMADNVIKSKFAELTEDVKALGRLEWKENQKVWTPVVLRRLSSDNTSNKLFKRQILQEMIWIILHKYIFCSPFRPFGEEGHIMETKWNDAYGTDAKFQNGCYTWPMPEMEAERWRYVNVKECRTALRQPVDSEWDPRAKLKMGFRSTLEDIREEFKSTIGDMVDLESSSIEAMEKIAKKAANVWLEYGMQRCRIVMVFSASSLKPVSERMRQARVGSIELVVVPELRRYGNSKGLELHESSTVSGCSGEKIPVSMSH